MARIASLICAGLAATLVALLLTIALTGPKDGYAVDHRKWPEAAQAVLRERPDEPLNAEQWDRINKLLNSAGHGRAEFRKRAAEELLGGWYVLVGVPLLLFIFTRSRLKGSPLANATAITGPSVVLLFCIAAAAWTS